MLLRVCTLNDNFNTPKSNIPLVEPYADVILTQENKWTKVKKVAGAWSSYQDTSSEAAAGSAIVWRPGKIRPAASGTVVGFHPHGAKMEARRPAWLRALVGTTRTLFVAAHRPPKRYRFLDKAYDEVLIRRIRLAQRNGVWVVLGMDANQERMNKFAQRLNLKIGAHHGIDMILVSHGIHVTSHRLLPKWTSDHAPLVATLQFP